MAKWNETLNLSDVWDSEKWTDRNVQELGKIVAERIRKLKSFDTEDWIFISDCVERFEDIYPYEEFVADDGELPYTPIEDFDEAMRELYDWADFKRVWVKIRL